MLRQTCMGGKTSTASKRQFNDKTYQRIVFDVRIDSDVNKEAIQQAAEKAGQSLTEYMLEAVRRRMEQEQNPGVVKNLEGDTVSTEQESGLSSPAQHKLETQRKIGLLPFTEM